MFDTKESKVMGELMQLAKEGDPKAQAYLKRTYSLRVFTAQEVERVNQLRFEQGLTINQAIEQAKEEEL